MRWVRGVVAVLLAGALVAGCGGGDGEAGSSAAGKKGGSTTTSSPGGDERARPGGDGGSTTGGDEEDGGASGDTDGSNPSSGGGSSSVKASGGDTDKMDGSELPQEPLPMTVELGSPCVGPGGDQTVTVRSVEHATVSYDVVWADGKNGFSAAHRGGTGNGRVDETGVWKSTFKVGTDAPKGVARVELVGGDIDGRFGRATLEFTVGDALGRCG